jgi:uncharacterized membrane protein
LAIVLSAMIFTVLLGIALVHFAWALGSVWPATNEKALARLVIGEAGKDRMPSRLLTAIVAIAIAIAGVLPTLLSAIETPPLLRLHSGWWSHS